MTRGRAGHTATLLPDGRVLVAGGLSGSEEVRASAELYDSGNGSWTVTGGMDSRRSGHTATLLPDGTVLVAGGFSSGEGPVLASAELYDPDSGTWTATGNMIEVRTGHRATLLPDGKVLVSGGASGISLDGYKNALGAAEIYDPSGRTWTATGNMDGVRYAHSATPLPDGTVLVAGGHGSGYYDTLNSAERYDPSSGTWAAIGSMGGAREGHTATRLPDGTVLVVGNITIGDTYNPLASAELYDPANGTWIATGNMDGRGSQSTATLLLEGTVLVAGGGSGSTGVRGLLASAELYDPGSGIWAATRTMARGRAGHTATLLLDGTVLVAGGAGGSSDSVLASAELYDPGGGS
jgi:hypothetical protein